MHGEASRDRGIGGRPEYEVRDGRCRSLAGFGPGPGVGRLGCAIARGATESFADHPDLAGWLSPRLPGPRQYADPERPGRRRRARGHAAVIPVLDLSEPLHPGNRQTARPPRRGQQHAGGRRHSRRQLQHVQPRGGRRRALVEPGQADLGQRRTAGRPRRHPVLAGLRSRNRRRAAHLLEDVRREARLR